MSTAASQPLPRTPSSARQHNYAPVSDRQPISPTPGSATSRTAMDPSPRRTPSGSQPTSSRSRSASGAQGSLSHVAQRDVEQTNIAKPSASRRSESKDRTLEIPKVSRSQSVRTSSTPSSSSRHGNSKRESETPSIPDGGDKGRQTSTATSSTGAGRNASVANSTGGASATDVQPRRRTAIDATTGTWELGKTIGAGSMGKVKLAKNKETNEQVSNRLTSSVTSADHSADCRQDRTTAIDRRTQECTRAGKGRQVQGSPDS